MGYSSLYASKMVYLTITSLWIISNFYIVMTSALPMQHLVGHSGTKEIDNKHEIEKRSRTGITISTGQLCIDLSRIGTKLAEGNHFVENDILRSYKKDRFPDEGQLKKLANESLMGFPLVALTDEISLERERNPLSRHLVNYGYLSIATVFVKHVLFDDEKYDDGEYHSELYSLQTKIDDIIFNLRFLLEDVGFGTDDLEKQTKATTLELPSISSITERQDQHYKVIHKTGKLLSFLTTQYKAWKKYYDCTN